jgi:hypothetical protein
MPGSVTTTWHRSWLGIRIGSADREKIAHGNAERILRL